MDRGINRKADVDQHNLILGSARLRQRKKKKKKEKIIIIKKINRVPNYIQLQVERR